MERKMQSEIWQPEHSRVAALTAFTGVLVGALRAKGLLSEPELKDLLATADAIAPNPAGVEGTVVLTLIKRVSDEIVKGSTAA
jgi:hypothetical protein